MRKLGSNIYLRRLTRIILQHALNPLVFLGILDISDISENALIISIMMLYITTYIAIDSLSRIIRTYIIFFITLSILIFTLKTNNLDDISRYTLNLALNSRLR